MIIKDFPCKNCKKRKVGCHSYCTDYKTAKSNYEKDKKDERASECADRFIAESTMRLSYIRKNEHFRRNYYE